MGDDVDIVIRASHPLDQYTHHQLWLVSRIWVALNRGVLHWTEPPQR